MAGWSNGRRSVCGRWLSLQPIGCMPALSLTSIAPLQLQYAACGTIQVLYAFAFYCNCSRCLSTVTVYIYFGMCSTESTCEKVTASTVVGSGLSAAKISMAADPLATLAKQLGGSKRNALLRWCQNRTAAYTVGAALFLCAACIDCRTGNFKEFLYNLLPFPLHGMCRLVLPLELKHKSNILTA